MKLSDTKEQAFEYLIEKALVGSTVEERKASDNDDIEAQNPGPNQYYWGRPKDMPSKLAIDERRLWSFLESTQRDVLDEYRGKDLKSSVERQIFKDIATFGIIKLIREGVEVDNIKLKLFYPKPTPSDSETSREKYAKNQFSITRQQTFSLVTPELEIDIVVFVNGLPIFTFERFSLYCFLPSYLAV